jgi:hypothetical protein
MHGAVAAVAKEFMLKRLGLPEKSKPSRSQESELHEETREDAAARTSALINAPPIHRGRKFEVRN